MFLKLLLFVALATFCVWQLVLLIKDVRRRKKEIAEKRKEVDRIQDLEE